MVVLVGILAWVLLPLTSVAFDILPTLRAGRRRVCDIDEHTPSIDDFEVLVPIYGDVKYLENLDYLEAYGSKVLLCTTDQEDERFNHDLAMAADRHGLRIFKTRVPGRRAEAGQRSVAAPVRDKLIRDALAEVKATYVVCIDADTITEQPLNLLVGALEASHLDVASVRLLPSNNDTLLARLQCHEYRMAMRMRRLYPWLVSGACHVARTTVHHSVMLRHSLFFQGNDAEFGMLAEAMGYNVGHIPFDVPTTVPSRLKPWWRQRFAWSGGEFRIYIVNVRLALRHPYFYVYGAVVVTLAVPLRWASVIALTWTIPFVLAVYWVCFVVLNWRTRNWAIVALPFYSLAVTLVLVPLGVWSYVRMATTHHNWGIIRPGRRMNVERRSESIASEMIDAVYRNGLTVGQLQLDLAEVGCDPGVVDGVFGARTKRALVTWQRHLIERGYDLGASGADGVFGVLTARASRDEGVWIGIEDHTISTDDWVRGVDHGRFQRRDAGDITTASPVPAR